MSIDKTDGVSVFVETHILDFDNDIYGNEIEVTFIKAGIQFLLKK